MFTARKSTDFVMVVHVPAHMDKTSYQDVFDKFRLGQIKKHIAGYPPKTKLAFLEELEKKLNAMINNT